MVLVQIRTFGSQLVHGWRETGATIRRLCVILPIAGTVFIAVGVVGDASNWWKDKPFLTNLVSSMASAMFGIPLALVVFQRLTALQAERLEKRAAYRMLHLASIEMQAAVSAIAHGQAEIRMLPHIQHHIEHTILELRKASTAYHSLHELQTLTSGYFRDSLAATKSFMVEVLPYLRNGLDAMNVVHRLWRETFLTETNLDGAWKEIHSRREYLDNYVVPRLITVDAQSPAVGTILKIGDLLEERVESPDWAAGRWYRTEVEKALGEYHWGFRYISPEVVVASVDRIVDSMECGTQWLDWYVELTDQVILLDGSSG